MGIIDEYGFDYKLFREMKKILKNIPKDHGHNRSMLEVGYIIHDRDIYYYDCIDKKFQMITPIICEQGHIRIRTWQAIYESTCYIYIYVIYQWQSEEEKMSTVICAICSAVISRGEYYMHVRKNHAEKMLVCPRYVRCGNFYSRIEANQLSDFSKNIFPSVS